MKNTYELTSKRSFEFAGRKLPTNIQFKRSCNKKKIYVNTIRNVTCDKIFLFVNENRDICIQYILWIFLCDNIFLLVNKNHVFNIFRGFSYCHSKNINKMNLQHVFC